MISAAAVEQAAELLCDREGIAETLTAMKAAKFCRIEFTPNDPNKGTANWRASAEMKISAPIRQLLQAGVQSELDEIDGKLRALGVEPPAGEIAA